MKRHPPSAGRLSRRRFLKGTGATVAATTLSGPARAAASPASPEIPPHRALDVPGIHAYPMEHSVAAGGTLELCVSSTVSYRLSICRLGLDVDDPAGDTVLASFDEAPANPQPIHSGSYIHVGKRLDGPLDAITLECWLRPWDFKRLQGVISQRDTGSRLGLALEAGPDGYVGFYLGDGTLPDDQALHRTKAGLLTRNKWYHLVATWDGPAQARLRGREGSGRVGFRRSVAARAARPPPRCAWAGGCRRRFPRWRSGAAGDLPALNVSGGSPRALCAEGVRAREWRRGDRLLASGRGAGPARGRRLRQRAARAHHQSRAPG